MQTYINKHNNQRNLEDSNIQLWSFNIKQKYLLNFEVLHNAF